MLLRLSDRRLRRDFGHGRQPAPQGEKKNAVSAWRGGKETATGINCHIFVAFILEDARGSVYAGASLELPKSLAVGGVERGHAAVVSAYKDKPAGSGYRSAVATILPSLLPNETVGLHVERRKNSV